MAFNIIVCAKQVPDTNVIKINPKTGTLIRDGVPSILNNDDANALEEALKIKDKYEPLGVKVFATSTLTGKGIKELLYYVSRTLSEIEEKPITFEQEFFPEDISREADEAVSVYYDQDEAEYVVEGPKIEKMLGYTNLDSEKGFAFFQKFMADNGILDELEKLHIQEGDTVRMYGFSFEYYRNADTEVPESDDETDEDDE